MNEKKKQKTYAKCKQIYYLLGIVCLRRIFFLLFSFDYPFHIHLKYIHLMTHLRKENFIVNKNGFFK